MYILNGVLGCLGGIYLIFLCIDVCKWKWWNEILSLLYMLEIDNICNVVLLCCIISIFIIYLLKSIGEFDIFL